jgi:maltoporin
MKTCMLPNVVMLAAAALISLWSLEALAAADAEQLREELRQLQQDYEQRLQRIEDQLQRLETPPGAPTNAVLEPTAPARMDPAAVNTNAAVAARKFVAEQFARDTESRERAVGVAAAPFRDRVEQVLQNFVDVTGYLRAGYGRNSEGGPQVAFQAPGAFAKYRLGNEAETYGELTFSKNFYAPGSFKLDPNQRPAAAPIGPIARVQTTISIYNPYQDLLSSSDTTFGLPEAWAAIGNVLPSQPSMKFWAGNRFYRRHDIHINDFFFYNMSGAGGGVEDIELPFGKLALAWIGAASRSGFSDVPQPDPTNEAGFSKANWDLRVYDVPLPFGTGEFGFVYARADAGLDAAGASAPKSDGVAITLLHTRDHFISADGVNKFSVQFGTGAAKTFTSGFETFTLTNGVFIRPDEDDSWRFRVTESFTANVNDNFSIGPALVYQLTDYGDQGGRVHWASAGVRPMIHFNEYLSLAFEGGVDWVKDEPARTSGNLYKFTVAPQVSLGGRFMSRPVIRAFVTYAHWSEVFVGQIGGNDYVSQDDGFNYGVQMEVWW